MPDHNHPDSSRDSLKEAALPAWSLMHSGSLYNYEDENLCALQRWCCEQFRPFNHTDMTHAQRRALLGRLCLAFGENSWIEPPLYSNWGAHHLHVGKNVYMNFNCMLVDDGMIYLEDQVLIGPGVTLISGSHPTDPLLRAGGLQFTDSIRICQNAWIGAGSIIMPGVTIGENSVIGAGSIVTKDIPANVIALGSPCRIVRPVSEQDRAFYHKNRPVIVEELPRDVQQILMETDH